ncbi:DNA replication complex GINS protein psf3 [Fimicolochytrium jonesii]|uniref:DNA replication complex GINS protein psf3 n=1 Tax=Fimicolochytrium jonesii TaxID=1396493 RepID=UPI0022FDDC09|nr:DNA replication complex GINS protein psf3 [Fimicolochytrium jonesii]KAI8817972.1 DNA replication complex GINS protein psf3 [Fimicolochytrium jonesii]
MPGNDYWDLDAIIADHQKLPCFFHNDVPGYGFLEGNHETDLSANAKVELPYWLAEHLAVNDHVDLELPKCFNQRVRDDISASPTSVNLNRLCPYYYRFGVNIINLIVDAALPEVLSQAFKARLPCIMDYTQTSRLRTDRSEFIHSLDETERELYKLGHETVMEMMQWDRRKAVRIQTAEILSRRVGRH